LGTVVKLNRLKAAGGGTGDVFGDVVSEKTFFWTTPSDLLHHLKLRLPSHLKQSEISCSGKFSPVPLRPNDLRQ